jgi:hypothetical protein
MARYTSYRIRRMTAMRVTFSVTRAGSIRSFFKAVNALQYCSLDFDSSSAVYDTLDRPARPTASMAARKTLLGPSSRYA